MSDLLHAALAIAHAAHEGVDRKYVGLPYLTHPMAVAALVRGVTDDEAAIAAACLHDVLEDAPGDPEDWARTIEARCGPAVLELVRWLTDTSRPEDGNRAARKAIDRERLARAPDAAQTVKLADLIDNSDSILEHDPRFAVIYLREKSALLDVLTRGDARLLLRARRIVDDHARRAPRPR
mgnify:CR=1 FL=1